MNWIFACYLTLYVATHAAAGSLVPQRVPVLLWMKGDDNLSKYVEVDPTWKTTDSGDLVANGTIRLKIDLPESTKFKVAGYEKGSDKKSWKSKPSIVMTDTLCHYLKSDKIFVPEVVAKSNLKRQCPIKKELYTLNDANFGNPWPPFLDSDNWKFILNVDLDQERSLKIEFEFEALYEKKG